MEMKSVLKTVRRHIDEKEFEIARKLVEDLLEEDVSDYLLYIFAAIIYSELGHFAEAVKYYKKAATLDQLKPLAWQGLYRLYEQGKWDNLEYLLVVIRNLITISGTASEKVSDYEKEEGYILLKLGKFDEAFSNPHRLNDVKFCNMALEKILSTDSWKCDRKQMVENCLAKIDVDKLDSKIHRMCAELLCCWAMTMDEIWEILTRHLKYVSAADNCLLTEYLRYFVIISYMEQRQSNFSNEITEMLKNAISKETNFEVLLGHIQRAEMTAAVKNIEKAVVENRCKWPYIGLAVPVLLSQERYEQAISFLDTTISEIHPAINECLTHQIIAAKCEALYGIHDSDSLKELTSLLASSTISNRLCRNLRLTMICENSELDDASKFELLQAEKFDDCEEEQFWKALLMKNLETTTSLNEAKKLAEIAVKNNPQSWQRLLLFAEICLKLDAEDPAATSALLKAAKLNVYSSKIFLCLGKSLMTKNRSKAIMCLERAAKIRPRNTEVAVLRDELLGLEGRKEEQLQHMRLFVKEVPSSLWARKRLALLEVEHENIDAAIDQLQHIVAIDKKDAAIWTALGDAYKKRGSYQSAIKAYKEAMDREPANDVARVQFIQMCHLIDQLEEAIEQCVVLEQRIESGQSTTRCVFLLHAHSLLKLAQKSTYSLQIVLLSQFFHLTAEAFLQNPEYILSFKLAADGLLMAARYHVDTFEFLKFPEIWKIKTAFDALELAIRFYCSLVKARPNLAASWNDLGVALLRKCQLMKNRSGCANAVECFKRAIKLSSSRTMKSTYWTNLSEAIAHMGNALVVQHCLVRALQLNVRNDTAWFLLGLLYLKYAKTNQAQESLNMAQKINPESAEIWCALATLAETENHYDTMDLYRHSLTLKPTELAVKKYTYYVLKMLSEGKHCDDATMFDFEFVHEIIGISKRSDEFIFYVSLLAEHFWYMDYAAHYINCCHDWPNLNVCKLHKERIGIRSGRNESSDNVETLQKLLALYSSTTREVYEKLLHECPVYAQLFTALEQNDVKHFRAILMNSTNKIQIPLLIAAVIYFKIKLDEDFINVVDDVRPRHQISLVYPPSKLHSENDEFSYDVTGEVGEKTIVRYDNMSKRLCELLAIRIEQHRWSKTV